MSQHNKHPVKLGELLSLHTSSGPFQLHNAWLHVQYSSGSEVELDVYITFEGDLDTWNTIQEEHLFGVVAENVGPIWGGKFKSEQPLIFEIRQRTTSTTFLGILTEHPLDAAIKLIEAPMTAEFRQEMTYHLIAVKQMLVPGVFSGLQVHHPESEHSDASEIESIESIQRVLSMDDTQSELIADFESVLKKPTS
jgi:hypothetical protein